MGRLFMRLGKAIGILISSSLLLTGAALAGSGSDSTSRKGDHGPQKSAPAAVPHLKPQAPTVMGRSVSPHRKSKPHHAKVIQPESNQVPGDSQL